MVNVAIGNKNEVDQASIRMAGSKVNGVIINDSDGKNLVNVAIGNENKAAQNSVILKGFSGERGCY